MPSQEMLDAAMKAAMPIVDRDIDKGLSDPRLGFFRQRISEGIHEHRSQIQAGVREILAAGIDAALAVPPVKETPPSQVVIEPKSLPLARPIPISPVRKSPVGD